MTIQTTPYQSVLLSNFMEYAPSPFINRVIHWQTRSGTPLTIRHIRSKDTPLMVDLFYRLSTRTLSLRFATAMVNIPLKRVIEEASRLATINPENAAALVALEEDMQGHEHIVAVARLAGIQADTAEFALTVRDDFQGQGVGSYMLDLLLQVALAKDLKTVTAVVAAENTPMMKLIQRIGHPINVRTSQGESDVTIFIRNA